MHTPVHPGDILARKYRVDRVLGAGNMGVVVAATHVDLGQVVALKHMHSGKDATPEQRERFLREARAAVRLRSHHVARVLDVGANPDEAPYIVMEYLEGHDLAALLKQRGQLPFEEAVEYVLQTCEAVGEAHAAGIVHRDLKPANLFLTQDVSGAPCVRVLDFGISKLADATLALTNESQALGSPLYMSPEQMNSSRSVDARSDVWALGVILYQLVAGRTPFGAETIQELCTRVLMGAPTPLAEFRPDAPPGFEAAILRCLERDRERRFRDVAEFAAAIAPYAPEHARVYAQRVARVVQKAVRAGSTPEPLAPPVVRSSVPSVPQTPFGPPPPPAPVEATAAPATVPLPTRMLPFAQPEPPRAIAPIAPVLGATTGLSLSSSQRTTLPLAHAGGAKPRGRAPLFVAGGLAAIAIAVAGMMALGRSGTGTGQASTGSPSSLGASVAAADAPANPVLVVTAAPSAIAPPLMANTAGTATAEATGSSGAPAPTSSTTKPAPSSSARRPPLLKSTGSKAKSPPDTDSLYKR